MKIEDIKDEQTLRAWLNARPEETRQTDAIAIAQRCALRVLPFFGRAMHEPWATESGVTALSVLRQLLSFAVARKFSTPALMAASASAFGAASASASAAASASGLDAVYASAAALAVSAALNASAARTSAAFWAELRLDADMLQAALDPAITTIVTAALAFNKTHPALWAELRLDAKAVQDGGDPAAGPLWSFPPPHRYTRYDTETRAIWAKDPPGTWDFWTRWWDGVLSGQQLDWELQKAVALISDDIWSQGPAAVAEAIRLIERAMQQKPADDPIEDAIAQMSAQAPAVIQRFSEAVTEHREDLPPTLDALIGYVGQEIDRLQFRNAPYATSEEEIEAQRQIRVLTTIWATLQKLRETIPAEGALTVQGVERAEKLSRLFLRQFKEWPRQNADDLVDSTCRAALVGVTAVLLPMIGAPVSVAIGGGVILFGGKKVADSIKATKDLGGLGQ